MTGATASDYDASMADLVVRTLRAVAEATPIDATLVDVEPPMAVLAGAVVEGSVRRRRHARWLVGAGVAMAAAALVVSAVWIRDDGRVETSPLTEQPVTDAERRPLDEEQVVARGEVDGQPWTFFAQPFEDGILCLELSGSAAGCGAAPTDESPLGAVYQGADHIEGTGFVFGAVVPTAAQVTVELANGQELSVDPSQPTFGFRYYVIPVSAGTDAVAVTVLDSGDRQLERIELET